MQFSSIFHFLVLGTAIGQEFQAQIPLGSSKTSTDALPEPPLLGFGTWRLKVNAQNTTDAVAYAIKTGYRHIDCAAAYGNQKDVGRGIAEGVASVTGLTREKLWITSKLWNDHHAPDKVEEGLDNTLAELGLDYLDLFLMHWPVGKDPDGDDKYKYDYVSTWHALEKVRATGKVRNIGVANFSPHQLKKLIAKSTIKPHMHQFELHPYLQQSWWVDWHKKHGIKVTAYSPFGNMNPIYRDSSPSSRTPRKIKKDGPPLLLKNKQLEEIAKKHDATTAQVALSWGISRGTCVIPKSSHEKWIEENYGSQAVILDKEDNKTIKALGKKYLTRFNNPSDGWDVDLFEGLDDA